uniref:HTH_Tnp_Tc3_2 domain-containing protein n=1 Tax=Heterorhabditis bacteriophora TaxID=37862 RepID=A0A1I7WID3_HETBA
MGRAPKLNQHERDQIKALSTVAVVKCSRKAVTDFLRLQKEYAQRRVVENLTNLITVKRTILRTASNSTKKANEIRRICAIDASESTVKRKLNNCPNIARSRMKKCPQLTQGQEDERLCWARNSTKTYI